MNVKSLLKIERNLTEWETRGKRYISTENCKLLSKSDLADIYFSKTEEDRLHHQFTEVTIITETGVFHEWNKFGCTTSVIKRILKSDKIPDYTNKFIMYIS